MKRIAPWLPLVPLLAVLAYKALADTVTPGLFSVDGNFSVYNSANLAAAASLNSTKITNASTMTADSAIGVDIVGVGGANFVAKLCSDGTTCAAGNVYLTCTISCTAVVGTVTACAVTKAAVPPASTLTWGVATACATTDPGVNINAHWTTP